MTSSKESFEYKKGNVSSIHTSEKQYMTIDKAKEYALKNTKIVGFSVESDAMPTDTNKEYLIHFKEGGGNVYDIGKWHTFFVPQFTTSIISAAQQLETKLDIKDRRYQLKSYKQCFIGSEAIKVMIQLNFASNEQESIEFGNRLMQSDLIQHVERDHTFKNSKLYYRFTQYYHRSKLQSSMDKTQSMPIQSEMKENDTKINNDTQPTPKQIPSPTDNSNSQASNMAEQKSDAKSQIKNIYENVIKKRDPNQVEFLEAAEEVLSTLAPLFEKYPQYIKVLPAICEPERIFQFRVPWTDRDGKTQINRGFRCQFNQAIGPYKGGLRFHPTVNQSIVKFLGFEQIFKNALTGLPMGGGKGGSDFNPKGKTDAEVLSFCQSFMTELSKYIGADTDVPAGDIGVGGREIGYLFGQWKRLTVKHVGVLTGKGYGWGGSLIRPEATGYGLVYITQYALQDKGDSLKGKKVAVSGSGNVATFAVEKLFELGATVVSMSDSGGSVIEKAGFTKEQFAKIREIKDRRGRIKEYMDSGVQSKDAKYVTGDKSEDRRPWRQLGDCGGVQVALPCATQNEIDAADAKALITAGVKFVAEGANMPSDPAAIAAFKAVKDGFFIPAKASNAGGVGVSGLEMAQNSQRVEWSREEVDKKLQGIMRHIFDTIKATALDLQSKDCVQTDFQLGANAAGFKKVADAMLAQGQVL